MQVLEKIVWFLRSASVCIVLFLCYVLFFPVQLLSWIAGRETWSNTLPYLYIDYLWVKGTAETGQKVPGFQIWRHDRYGCWDRDE